MSLPGKRKKVDLQFIENLNRSGIPLHMKRDCFVTKSDCDMRRSLAWDSAFFTSPGVLDADEMFETLNFRVADNGVDITGEREMRPLPSQFVRPEQMTGTAECGVRKSLAWDSAFFTNAGVLDSEELAIVNRGFKKCEMYLLPGIEEDIWRSSESNSTMNSDYSLVSLEIDLFHDMRASVVKSHEASSNQATSSHTLRRQKGIKTDSKVSDVTSRARYYDGWLKRTASSRQSKLSLRPPKKSGHADSVPKIAPIIRASLGENHVKIENKSTKVAPQITKAMSKKTRVWDSCSSLPSSRTPTKSPSSVSPNNASQFAGHGFARSHFPGRSPSDSLRRTINSSLSSSRTPKKCSAGNKTQLMNSNDSVSLLSTPKSSSCTSPASSLDEWSPESSSSLNHRSKIPVATHVTATSRMISFDIDASNASNPRNHPYAQQCPAHGTQEARSTNPQMEKISARTSLLPPKDSRNCKSSGLRMPSPKLGFFDTENCTCLAPTQVQKFPYDANHTSKMSVRARSGKPQLAGSSVGVLSKIGVKDEGQMHLREKKRPCKEYFDVEGNKENACDFENQVDELSKHMESFSLSRDLVTV